MLSLKSLWLLYVRPVITAVFHGHNYSLNLLCVRVKCNGSIHILSYDAPAFEDEEHAPSLLYQKRIDYYNWSLLMSISTGLENNDVSYYEQMKSGLKTVLIEELISL